jgi:hypothetical protein
MNEELIMKYFDLIKNDDQVFLKFLKAKYPFFHNSNFFFRDLQFGLQKYLEKKGIKISNKESEELANRLGDYLEEKKIFIRVNLFGWRLNYPEFVTTAPGDPL